MLRDVVFNGASEVSQAKLGAASAGFQGALVSLADLRTIGRRAEAIYVAAGYPFVAVRLQAQQVKDGIVHFEVVEGRITGLTVLGSDPAARRQATAMLEPLVNRPALSLAAVEYAYELVRAVPGLSTSGTLRPADEPGGMDLVVAAKRADPLSLYANLNDLYADSVGPWGALVGAEYNGNSQFGDQATFQAYTSLPFGRQVLLRGGYSYGLDSAGARFSVSGLWGDADPTGADARQLQLATKITAVRLELSQPLVERPDANAVFDLALDASNQRTQVFSAPTLSNDKLRVLDLSLAGEDTNGFGKWSGSIDLRQGLDILGSSRPDDPNLSRLGGNPLATVFKVSFEAQTASFHSVSFAARSDIQYAANPLTEPDQYTFGNLSIGRGYQPGLALADSVIAASLEARLGPFPVSKALNVQPFLFVDDGRLFSRGATPFTLTSCGFGARLQVFGKFEADLVYAEPLEGPPGAQRPSPSVLLNMTVSMTDLFASIHRRIAAETGK